MKPAWDQLIETYADSSSVLVADVDCTSDVGKDVCSAQSVQGYPTIKYYTSETGKAGTDYSGGRDYDALSAFVEKELAEECDVKARTGCSEKEIAYIEKKLEGLPPDRQPGVMDKESAAWNTEAKRLAGMADKGMHEEKRQWLNQRINILEQLLDRKVVRRKKGGWSWFFWVGSLLLSTVAVVVTYFASTSASGPSAEGGDSATAPKEGEKTD